MKPKFRFFHIIVALVMVSACSRHTPKYLIGVSQCSQDIWRDKLNRELQAGAYFHDGVELRFASADDNDDRQIEQIERFIDSGVDLLIVAPNQVATVTPAIDRAFDRGIPVIVFDRRTNSEKFTAYIGADNCEMGRMMGEFIAAQLKGRGRVLEVMGLKGSSPAIERHEGFVEALSHYPGIELVASLQGDWTEQSAVNAIEHYDGDLCSIDYVFGQNDRMAMGARRVLLNGKVKEKSKKNATAADTALETSAAANTSLFTFSSSPKFCGIDGLPGKGGGIELVRDSLLIASCIYPTHGDEVLQLAIDILEGKPFKKDSRLRTAIVTHDNANVLMLQSEETERQTSYLDRLHEKADSYLEALNTQRTNNVLACGVIVLLLLVILLFYLFQKGKITLRRQRVVSNLWNLETNELKTDDGAIRTELVAESAHDEPTAALSEPIVDDAAADAVGLASTTAEQPASPVAAVRPAPAAASAGETSLSDATFIGRFREVVERRLQNSELSVEDLAADMHLSRVQLYRKVKNITGSSPIELLRTARLNRGYQLLLTTDKSVSEVAYTVGFTAPSYFTKCFKDEFGMAPSELSGS